MTKYTKIIWQHQFLLIFNKINGCKLFDIYAYIYLYLWIYIYEFIYIWNKIYATKYGYLYLWIWTYTKLTTAFIQNKHYTHNWWQESYLYTSETELGAPTQLTCRRRLWYALTRHGHCVRVCAFVPLYSASTSQKQ